ncbi:MAG: sugar transferase [bacterium]|nr:sugar transferase [bacterium]
MTDAQGKIKKFILYAGDIILLYAVLALVLLVRYQDKFSGYLWQLHLLPFTIIFVVWLAVFYISGLYDTKTLRNGIDFYTLVFKTVLLNAILAVFYFYVFSNLLFTIRPLLVFATYLAFFSVLFLFWRRTYNHLTESQIFLQRVLCIGDGADMKNLIEELGHKPHFGYRVVAHVPAQELQGKFLSLKALLAEKKIDTVITSLELNKYPELVAEFYKNLFLGVKYVDLAAFYEKITGRVPISTIGQLWFLENISENDKKYYEFVKRALEVILAMMFCAIGIIFSPFIALAIKLNSAGPIFFMQDRIGKDGKKFKAAKFRTMLTGADREGPRWTAVNDPRVTQVGRFLRKTKLDEIPQLVNILRGEMSFIGPRPEQPEFVRELTQKIPYYNERHLAKPGLTGWAQINFPESGASEQDTIIKLQYDLFYIKNRSLLLDLGIILKTVNIILTGQGR